MQQGDNVFNSSEKLKWPFNLVISQQKPLLFLFFPNDKDRLREVENET